MKKKKKKVQKKIRKRKYKKNRIIRKKKSIKRQKKIKTKKKKPIKIAKKSDKFLLKIIELQSSLKPEFKIKFNPFVAIDNFLQKFFQKVSDTISKYEVLKDEQKRIRKLNELERIENEKIERRNKIKTEKELKIKLKEQMLKDEIRLEKERAKDIKIFLRKEQAIIRQEQAEKQRKFLEELKIDPQELGSINSLYEVNNPSTLEKMIKSLSENLNELGEIETESMVKTGMLKFVIMEIWKSLSNFYNEDEREEALKYFLGLIQNDVAIGLIKSMDMYFRQHHFRDDPSQNQF
mgnify:CR=1 FL=1